MAGCEFWVIGSGIVPLESGRAIAEESRARPHKTASRSLLLSGESGSYQPSPPLVAPHYHPPQPVTGSHTQTPLLQVLNLPHMERQVPPTHSKQAAVSQMPGTSTHWPPRQVP